MTSFFPSYEPYSNDGCGSYTDDEDPIEEEERDLPDIYKNEED